MRIFKDINLLKTFTFKHRKAHQSIGLVPTMGALHQGHMSLIRSSIANSDITICSIYVNPTQFNNQTDLINYPRTLEADLEALNSAGCDAVFIPEDDVMYSSTPVLNIEFGALGKVLEGVHRPGHFNGVGLVVSKLFHMVMPDHAYFGQKDWQQVAIIKQLVLDFSFPLEIIDVPIVREEDGLAMSSRNRRLKDSDRLIAPQLYQALTKVKANLEEKKPWEESRTLGLEYIQQFPEIEIEYLEIVNSQTLQKPTLRLDEEPLSICLAAYLGGIRLIDNVKVF